MKVREFLVTQGQGTVYLQDNKMMIPFINRPHHLLKLDTNAFEQLLEKKATGFTKSLSALKIKLHEETRKREQLQEQMDDLKGKVDDLLGKRTRDQETISNLITALEIQKEKFLVLETRLEWFLPRTPKSNDTSPILSNSDASAYLHRQWEKDSKL